MGVGWGHPRCRRSTFPNSVELCPEEGSELAAWRPDVVKSLLDILRDVTLDPERGAAFTADPSHYLAEQGYPDVADEDLREAFSLVADTLPPEQAQEVYVSHVASDVHDALQPFPAQDEPDPGAVYGHTTEDFDLDVDDAANAPIVDPDVDQGFGFGDGAGDHDDVTDLDADTMVRMDDIDDVGNTVDDSLGTDDGKLDPDAGDPLSFDDVDLNPFDDHDDLDGDGRHGFRSDDDTGHDHDGDDLDLGFF
jgi:hypothetical protein